MTQINGHDIAGHRSTLNAAHCHEGRCSFRHDAQIVVQHQTHHNIQGLTFLGIMLVGRIPKGMRMDCPYSLRVKVSMDKECAPRLKTQEE